MPYLLQKLGIPQSRMRMLYVLDLLGVAIFATSGALAGCSAGLDLLGILILASMTGIGGGTIRDLLLSKHPIFWIQDTAPLYTIIGTTILTIAWVQVLPVPSNALLIADALGLALFAISGAQVAEKLGCKPLVVILMGTLTGSGGGVVRDLLSDKIPMILHQDIYASAAIVGIAVYLLLRAAKVPTGPAFAAGFLVVAGTRLAAINFGLTLPLISLQN